MLFCADVPGTGGCGVGQAGLSDREKQTSGLQDPAAEEAAELHP